MKVALQAKTLLSSLLPSTPRYHYLGFYLGATLGSLRGTSLRDPDGNCLEIGGPIRDGEEERGTLRRNVP